MKIYRTLFLLLIVLGLLATACGRGATVIGINQSGEGGGAVGPQEITNATEVLKFDPATIPLTGRDPVPGSCRPLDAVPGTYACLLASGETTAPCFALSGERLMCRPDPVARSYQTLVRPDAPLPAIAPPPPDQATEFFVELEGDPRTCAIRTGIEPVIIGGVAATFDCDAPYTYLLGFEKSAPTWEAARYTLDPATGQSPSGKVPVNVVRAWIP